MYYSFENTINQAIWKIYHSIANALGVTSYGESENASNR